MAIPDQSSDVSAFIARWSNATPSERANSQLFLAELCDVLGVDRPDPKHDSGYCFEHVVTEQHVDGSTSQGRIDLYKRACFVLESKQFQEAKAEQSDLELTAQQAGVIEKKKSSQPVRGTGAWDDAMTRARGQAERYVRALPNDNPPFIVIVDVGHTFELFADFTQAGKAYLPFPDPRTFRIKLADLADEKTRERLRLVWTNPSALDPARRSADVTREISAHLAELAKSLEKQGHEPEVVAQFLTRCLFCMFAEDVGLLPDRAFTELLNGLPTDGSGFENIMGQLFKEMNTGTGQSISVVLRKKLLRFNGGLFADQTVLPLNGMQLGLLKLAAYQNWRSVEPAIFGTLLERALNPGERHQLGAHFTPRAYVERLVLPTIIEPLRAEWANVRAAAITHARGDNLKKARAAVNEFHDKLCNIRVLDPACGTGNFLYVALQQLKILEGEVLDTAAQFGENFKLELSTHTIDPHQFLGIEINPRAAAIAELVLWIGYLQWHFRLPNKGLPPEPILRAFKNIECRDAVLEYDGEPEPARDEANKAVTVWDRISFKVDVITGRDVPDESKRSPLLTYKNSRAATWPQADYIVGNPPFIGNKRMRANLGDGYVDSLRDAYSNVPESADFVLYWWYKAAELVRRGNANRFGLITTNSLRQTFNRSIVQAQLTADPPLSLAFATPDHPWVDTAEGAAVRIAMTVGVPGKSQGELLLVIGEKEENDGSTNVTFSTTFGLISSDLTTGADVANAAELTANSRLSNQGMTPLGTGFRLSPQEAKQHAQQDRTAWEVLKPYAIGRDIVQEPEPKFIIDFFGLSIEQARSRHPSLFQHVLNTVKPERDQKERDSYRAKWWIFAEPRANLRPALEGLQRYIATCRTARHRLFVFMKGDTVPDAKIVAIALNDAFSLGILSSRAHVVWALATGARLGVGNDPNYNHSECFAKFPFPICEAQKQISVANLAEELDAHRKRVQTQHGITLTAMYNVLEKLRAGEELNAKEKSIHDKGLVSVLKQLHDDLDAAVFAAYGWPATLTDAEILERLVALNAERAAEEKRGIIRWLRPEYQIKAVGGGEAEAPTLNLPEPEAKPKAKVAKSKSTPRKQEWPKPLNDRFAVVEAALHAAAAPVNAETLAKQFTRAKPSDVAEILETLATLGRAHRTNGNYTR